MAKYDKESAGKEIVKKADKAFKSAERHNCEATWQLLAEFVLPSHNAKFFDDTSKGTRKDARVFDSTAIQCNRDLASAMHATITNPAMKWSKLRFKQDELNDDKSGGEWLMTATDAIHNALNDSNFDSQIGRGYQSLSGFGNMIIFHEELEKDGVFQGFNFTAWHIAELCFVENALGIIDTVYRKFKLSLKQAAEKFGEKIGEELIEKLETDPLMELEFVHCISPRPKNEIELNDVGLAPADKRPIASVYVMKKGSKIVKEDGFYEMPVYVARWSTLPGETYGYSPAHVALPDTRTLNKVREESLRALAKSVNPPIFTTKQNMISGDLRPGKISHVRDINQIKEFVTQTRFDAVKLEVEDLKGSIRSAFYIDKLLLPPRTETGEMTAYEIAQRLEQMQTILGPVLSRLNSEFLAPFILRCLKILFRAGQIPPIPPAVASKLPQTQGGSVLDFEIMFVNSLARSQQMSELRNVQSFLQETAALAQIDPQVLDNINGDAVISYMSKVRNIPENMTRDSKEVEGIRQQRAQQQQMQQAMSMGEQGSNIIKNIAPKGNQQ
jgi:hypothetical protein